MGKIRNWTKQRSRIWDLNSWMNDITGSLVGLNPVGDPKQHQFDVSLHTNPDEKGVYTKVELLTSPMSFNSAHKFAVEYMRSHPNG